MFLSFLKRLGTRFLILIMHALYRSFLVCLWGYFEYFARRYRGDRQTRRFVVPSTRDKCAGEKYLITFPLNLHTFATSSFNFDNRFYFILKLGIVFFFLLYFTVSYRYEESWIPWTCRGDGLTAWGFHIWLWDFMNLWWVFKYSGHKSSFHKMTRSSIISHVKQKDVCPKSVLIS